MSTASSRVLDTDALATAVSVVASHRRITLRDVAAETGLSPSTLTRVTTGQKPDADALLSILAWLGHDVPFTRPRTPLEAP